MHAFLEMYAGVRQQLHGRRLVLHRLRCDGAKEFAGPAARRKMLSMGVSLEVRAADDPRQLGRVEREFSTLFDMVRSMLIAASAPVHLWGLAVLHAIVLENWRPQRVVRLDKDGQLTKQKEMGSRHFALMAGEHPPNHHLRAWG